MRPAMPQPLTLLTTPHPNRVWHDEYKPVLCDDRHGARETVLFIPCLSQAEDEEVVRAENARGDHRWESEATVMG